MFSELLGKDRDTLHTYSETVATEGHGRGICVIHSASSVETDPQHSSFPQQKNPLQRDNPCHRRSRGYKIHLQTFLEENHWPNEGSSSTSVSLIDGRQKIECSVFNRCSLNLNNSSSNRRNICFYIFELLRNTTLIYLL